MGTAKRRGWVIALLSISVGLLMLMSFPMTAHTQGVFATNTPRPGAATAVSSVPLIPDGRIDQYALRTWLEGDLINLIMAYIPQLSLDDPRTIKAVQLLQYELEHRYPGAPHNSEQRQQLLQSMLNAPRGTIDMRSIVHPYIQEALNRRDMPSLANYNGFRIEIMLLEVDGSLPADAIIHTRYPANAETPEQVLYEDYVLAQVDSGGAYRLLNSTPLFPAAPFGDIESIELVESGDLNGDSLDEMTIAVHRGDVNAQLMIYGWRNGEFLNFVQPGETLEFGAVQEWLLDTVRVSHYRVESPEWGCIGQLTVDWKYTGNLFRRVVDPTINYIYRPQNSLACRLYEAEPLFSYPPSEAIATVQQIIAQSGSDEPDSQYAFDRAQVILAMLYALDGQPTVARDLVSTLQPDPGSFLESQVNAFLTKMGSAGVTAIDLCSALLEADEYGACDIDDVLARAFEANPLSRARPVVEQLQERGLPVQETVTVSSIGRANREAVSFRLFGASWWAFAPLQPDFYTPEITELPLGFEAANAPLGFLDAPQSAYDALLVSDNITAALAGVDNVLRTNPDLPLSPAARYLQAVSYDLAADRTNARQSYYALWVEYPDTLWGQLAASHLEKRV